jgi:hypothetical protein
VGIESMHAALNEFECCRSLRGWGFLQSSFFVRSSCLFRVNRYRKFAVTVFEMGIPLPHFCGNGGCAEQKFLIMSVELAHGIVLGNGLKRLLC